MLTFRLAADFIRRRWLKRCIDGLLVAMMLLPLAPMHLQAQMLTEVFLGDRTDGDYFEVYENWTARFAFNLTAPGDLATLTDAGGVLVQSETPTLDAVDFLSGVYSVEAATLNFTFSSTDLPGETAYIRTGIYDGDTFLGEYHYSLGAFPWITDASRQYTNLSINLADFDLLDEIADGRFVSLVIAPEQCGWFTPENDFRIDQASLDVEGVSVPVPAGVLLLGSAVLGIVGLRKKKCA